MDKLTDHITHIINQEMEALPDLKHKIAVCLVNLLALMNEANFDKTFKNAIELFNLSERLRGQDRFGNILIKTK